eukprot:tig00021105_g18219.t1
MVGVTGTVTSTGLLNANGGLNVRWNQFVVDMSGNTLATGMVGVTGTVTSTGLLNANGGLNVRWNQFVVDIRATRWRRAWSGCVDMSGNTLATGMVGVRGPDVDGLLNANGGLNVRWNSLASIFGQHAGDGMVGVTGTVTSTGC